MEDTYTTFIINEAIKVSEWIDSGKTYEEICESMKGRDHTGNTFGCAITGGIYEAKNRGNAEVVRRAHNKKYGYEGEAPGVINPAIVTVEI